MKLYQEIHDSVFNLLENQLPSFLTYHSPQHTAYVVDKAVLISGHESVDEEDLLLIKIAALFHDIGFIRQYKNHEEAGALFAREVLPGYTFNPDEIDKICGMIMATKIPHQPVTLHEMIVCDADLEYLGTDLFYPVSQLLYQEMHYVDPDFTPADFHQLQIRFLSDHRYHTAYCQMNREATKRKNLQLLIEGHFPN